MTSPVDICNRALSEIGTRSTIAGLDEASPEAINCSLHYDRLRKMILRGANWNFARAFFPQLTQIGTYLNSTSELPWLFTYAYPAEALRARYLKSPQWLFWGPAPSSRFIVSGKTILANDPQLGLVYTADFTNVDQFDPLFEDALVWALAAHINTALTGTGDREQLLQLASSAIMTARVADGNEGSNSIDTTPDWLLARDGYLGYGQGGGYSQLGWAYCSWEGGALAS